MGQLIAFPDVRAINRAEAPQAKSLIATEVGKARCYSHLQVVDGCDNSVFQASAVESWQLLERLTTLLERWQQLTRFQAKELELSQQWLVVLLKDWQQESCAVNNSSRELRLKSNREIVVRGMPAEVFEEVSQRLSEVPLTMLVLLR